MRGWRGSAFGPVPVRTPSRSWWRSRGAAAVRRWRSPRRPSRRSGRRCAAVLPRSRTELAAEVAAVDPGPVPVVPDPDLPVIQVTGTNGKTTTVRLLAHLVTSCGRRVAFSSTDGVYRGQVRVKKGDYSGFGGAAIALAQHPDVAVLETARGGILQRGIGVLHNDVAVVTNVSADHLNLHGVRTVDELAEVKATIVRITRPRGWDVLNADDPRVLAMRRHASGRPWLFSRDPNHPALREVLAEGGRATTVLDGRVTWLERGHVHPVVPLLDVPIDLGRDLEHLHVERPRRRDGGTRDRTPPPRRGPWPPLVRPRPRTQSRAREPVHARRPRDRDRLRPQRGRDARARRDRPRAPATRGGDLARDLHGRRPHRTAPPGLRVPSRRRRRPPRDLGSPSLHPRPYRPADLRRPLGVGGRGGGDGPAAVTAGSSTLCGRCSSARVATTWSRSRRSACARRSSAGSRVAARAG